MKNELYILLTSKRRIHFKTIAKTSLEHILHAFPYLLLFSALETIEAASSKLTNGINS
jgi:hypothetical protein